MPRGDNPNSRANLKPLEKGLPKKSQRDIQKKGSKAGNDAKKEYKSLTEALRAQVGSCEMEELTMMLFKRAKQGNLKAYELLRDQLGEKPVEKLSIATVDDSTVAEMKNAIAMRATDGIEQE